VLIENAIKHNVFSNELPLDIAIEVKEGFVHVINDKRQTKIKEESSGRGLLYLEVLYNRFDKKIEVISDEKQFIVKLPLL
jgi:two-component sensor histidine kinase